jgi:hypothetical protein
MLSETYEVELTIEQLMKMESPFSCPICELDRTIVDEDGDFAREPAYQIGYVDDPEYISPRCSECIEKAISR